MRTAPGFEATPLGAWLPIPPSSASTVAQPNYRLSESSLRYDARLDLGAWTNSAFNDSGWSSPTDWGAVGGLPWGALWQRSLPFWQELPLQDFVSTNVSSSLPPCGLVIFRSMSSSRRGWTVSNASGGQIITIQPDAAFNGGDASISDEYVTRAGCQSFEFPGWINWKLRYVHRAGGRHRLWP